MRNGTFGTSLSNHSGNFNHHHSLTYQVDCGTYRTAFRLVPCTVCPVQSSARPEAVIANKIFVATTTTKYASTCSWMEENRRVLKYFASSCLSFYIFCRQPPCWCSSKRMVDWCMRVRPRRQEIHVHVPSPRASSVPAKYECGSTRSNKEVEVRVHRSGQITRRPRRRNEDVWGHFCAMWLSSTRRALCSASSRFYRSDDGRDSKMHGTHVSAALVAKTKTAAGFSWSGAASSKS